MCVCVCVCVCVCACVWVNVCAYEFASQRYLFRNDELVGDGPAWPCRLRNVCVCGWVGERLCVCECVGGYVCV